MLSSDPGIRSKALQDYRQVHPTTEEALIEHLVTASQTSPPETQANALVALGELGKHMSTLPREKLITIVLGSFSSKNASLRAAAVQTTAKLKLDELSPFVEKAIRDPHVPVRLAALHAAMLLALPSLGHMAADIAAHDPDPQVVALALSIQEQVPVSPVQAPALPLVPVMSTSGTLSSVGANPPVVTPASVITPPVVSSAAAAPQSPAESNPGQSGIVDRVNPTDVYDGPFLKDAWAKDALEKQKAQDKAAQQAQELEKFCKENNTHIGCPGYNPPAPIRPTTTNFQ